MTINLFIPLQKVDEARREVWGIAAVEQPDRGREIMDYAASKPNFLKWSEGLRKATGGKSLGNVRAMHNHIAAGKLIHFEPQDDLLQFYIGAKIVDDDEWKKVSEGVYSGFSVGGRYGRRWMDPLLPGHIRYEAIPTEVSLADLPQIPGAQFEFIKADGATEMRKFAEPNGGNPMNLAELLAKLRQSEQEAVLSLADDLEKAAGPDELSAILEKVKTSDDEALAAVYEDLAKAFPPEENEEDNPESEDEPPAPGAGDGDPADEQPARMTAEGVKSIVLGILEELGLVTSNSGGQGFAMAADVDDLRKSLESLKTDEPADLEKVAGELSKRDEQIKGLGADLAKVVEAAETLNTRLEDLEKLGAVGPVLREISILNPQMAAEMQKAATLKDLMDSVSDPTARQILGAELARIEIKQAQATPIKE